MSYTRLLYHIVFSTKERRPLLTGELGRRTIEYIGGICRELNGQLLAAGSSADHLHLAVAVHPSVAVADLVGRVKSGSSGWIHGEFPEGREFSWQDGYAAFSVSPSVVARVKRYIQGQAEHHKKVSFQEELIALLKRHGIEYDERYICA